MRLTNLIRRWYRDRAQRKPEDVARDPRIANSRHVGGYHGTHHGDSGATTGTAASDVFVGRVAGDDLGYAGDTGAERRGRADPMPPEQKKP